MTDINVVADVSDYQVDPDFATASKALVGVIVKATEGLRGQYKIQEHYADKIAKARAAGLLVGSYHFGRPGSGIEQAKYFLETVGTTTGQLLALDCEGIYRNKLLVPSLSMSPHDAQDFVSYVKDQTKIWPGIYCGNDYLIPLLGGRKDGILSNCWLWLADYNDAPAWPKSVWPNCTLWQYTGDGYGSQPHNVEGIGDNVDRDKFFGSVDQLRGFWSSGGVPMSPPEAISSVQRIKAALNKALDPSPNLPTDGDYDPQTKAAVARYQSERNLVVDGWVGPQTAAALAPSPFVEKPGERRSASLKVIKHPTSGRKFKMGRLRPVARGPRFSLNNYLLRDLPAPPASVDYTANAAGFLAQVLGNDTLGDCTAAGAFHTGGLLLGGAGAAIPYTTNDVIAFYSATTGYIPGDESTDRGGDEQTVLNYWQQTGLLPSQHQIAGWLGVNGADPIEVKTALWLMENVYFGVELPDGWINPMPTGSGFVWDVAGDPDPDNGHCFVGVGYNSQGVLIDTWGMIGTMTWAALAKYACTAGQGELYTVLGPDGVSKATAKAPNGFDWSQLVADFDSMGGTVKVE